jgi:hypothetical protein
MYNPQDRAPIHTASDDIINQIDTNMEEADIVHEVTWKMINSGVEMKKGDVIYIPQISNIDGRYLYNGYNPVPFGYKGTIPEEFSVPEFPPRYWSSNPLIPYRYLEGSVILSHDSYLRKNHLIVPLQVNNITYYFYDTQPYNEESLDKMVDKLRCKHTQYFSIARMNICDIDLDQLILV